jgi:hypothetical protein
MFKIKTDKITAIHPSQWPSWAFVNVDDDTYTDSSWAGCDYRVADESSNSDGLAIDIFITGRTSKWNGVTFETRARISFPNDGEDKDTYTSGKVYSTAPIEEWK